MNERYYKEGAERASGVRALFERIAKRYDIINDMQSFGLHRYWKRRLLALAEVRDGEGALDVCCGTGDIAEALAAAGARVVGCDFSSAMLGVAKTRRPHFDYVQADALQLPFHGGHFDVVTIGYGLRNLADFERGIGELLRVMKPRGRLLILDFGKPQNSLWRALYFAYLRAIVPVFGLVFCGNAAAYSYIVESLERYPAQDGVRKLLSEAGCEGVEIYNFFGGVMSIHRAVKPALLRERDDVSLVTGHLVSQ